MNPRYQITISWSDEADCYIARVPALPGCISHGDTYQSTVANIEDAIGGFIASTAAHGIIITESA